MPIVIHEGKKVEYVKLGISLPEDLAVALDKHRVLPKTKAKLDRSQVIASAVEVYLASLGELPVGYEMSAHAERVRDALKAQKKGGAR